MKRPDQFSKRELVKIVEVIRDWLNMDQDDSACIKEHLGAKFLKKLQKEGEPTGKDLWDFLNPEKCWDGADILEGISDVLNNYGLIPTSVMTPGEAYQKATPSENWKDDSIQFPRLLAGIWTCISHSHLKDSTMSAAMGLPWGKIMKIFNRAEKEWTRIKGYEEA